MLVNALSLVSNNSSLFAVKACNTILSLGPFGLTEKTEIMYPVFGIKPVTIKSGRLLPVIFATTWCLLGRPVSSRTCKVKDWVSPPLNPGSQMILIVEYVELATVQFETGSGFPAGSR